MTDQSAAALTQVNEDAEFIRELAADGLQPLWHIMPQIAARSPARGGVPVHWNWRLLRNHAMRAGDTITAQDAERRVLVFENPSFRGQGRATSSLYAGIQLVLPGEFAPSHRHTASALRLIMEGAGAFTAVDGERVEMSPGDFVVTPSNAFHDHGNDTEAPVLWLDGLDVFVVNLLNAPFSEDYPEPQQPITRSGGFSLHAFGNGLVPAGFVRQDGRSPSFWWPYSRTRQALEALRSTTAVDCHLGFRMNFIDPTSGASPFKTLTAAMSLFPAGFASRPYRTTSGTVMTVVEGSGTVRVGDAEWTVAKNDVFIVPGWHWHTVTADDDLTIFGFSDEELQRYLGFWREERESPTTLEFLA